jgi:3-methyl-2-oxobutanoate hydroxymethyltransferase
MRQKITIADLIQAKDKGQRISAVSCYDYITARIIENTDIDMILVGDSAAQTVLGFSSTLPAKMDFMVDITAAVRRGAPNLCLVADMPFLSYQVTTDSAILNAGRFFTEAGADMVKIEVSEKYIDIVEAISNAGMAVMAHIGIRPQAITQYGRFKADATTAQSAMQLINLAQMAVQAGANALLLEGTAAEVAKIITEQVNVPVISCGSGQYCDGQILVAPDILGLDSDTTPKFVKHYENLNDRIKKAFENYSSDIKKNKFPDDDHSYHMKAGEFEKLQQYLENQNKE